MTSMHVLQHRGLSLLLVEGGWLRVGDGRDDLYMWIAVLVPRDIYYGIRGGTARVSGRCLCSRRCRCIHRARAVWLECTAGRR